jgi:glycerol-3-phosphate acyltransferase PlsY
VRKVRYWGRILAIRDKVEIRGTISLIRLLKLSNIGPFKVHLVTFKVIIVLVVCVATMNRQFSSLAETFATYSADVRLLPSVDMLMLLKVLKEIEVLVASATLVFFLHIMFLIVAFKHKFGIENLLAAKNVTLKLGQLRFR